jgi:acyl carrier protein phosphodiesterase
MADGIRGKQFETYPQEIQNGITLHRAIDTFTDAHPVFRESTKSYIQIPPLCWCNCRCFHDHFLAKTGITILTKI